MKDLGKKVFGFSKIILNVKRYFGVNRMKVDTIFDSWNELKKDLHTNKQRIHFKEREIWFISIGQNIATETYDKGEQFLRAVIIFRKIGKYNFLRIPLTPRIKSNQYRLTIKFQNRINDALLNQIRVFDSKRL